MEKKKGDKRRGRDRDREKRIMRKEGKRGTEEEMGKKKEEDEER